MLKLNFKKAISVCISLCLALSIITVPAYADGSSLAAFPGAEGGGMWTTGARGGENIEVYHVTRLDDPVSGNMKGTMRDAVSQSNRIVVFDVAGNIELTDTLTIKGSNITILGQTAPGDGICVKNANTVITGNNVILRYMRFRMGDELTMEEDSLSSTGRRNVIVDHCSISWCVDECASLYEMTDFTMQWCIISESLKESVHDKGSHGYGGIWGGTNASYHHNLLAHHDSRNPRIQGGSTITGSEYDMSIQKELTDLRNNVIYNWGGNSAYGGQAGSPVNIINCYYKYGPSTGSHKSRIFELTSGGNNISYDWSTDLYVDGNYVYKSSTVTNDNTKGVDKDSGTKNYYIWTAKSITEAAKGVHFRYANEYPITTQTAEEAYNSVLESAGASIVRDSVDERVINNVKNNTGKLINTPSDVGGYPNLTGTKAKDSDNDGIPNEWEDSHGLNKNDASDGLNIAPSGYTYVEEYANALADRSYVRNVDYDPDVPDYIPDDEDDEDEDSSPSYDVELVNQWKAKSGDENKAAGYAFMPGLVGMTQLERAMTDTKEYSDGFKHSFAITCKSTNGGWDAENGIATGCAMKYTAPEDGLFTIYAYGVGPSGTKHIAFYAVPEGAADPATENIFTEVIDESGKKVLCRIEVEAGKSYYFYIAGGSKTRFMGAKFERIIPKPYEITSLTAENGTVTAEVTCNRKSDNAKLLLIGYDTNGKLTDAAAIDIPSDASKSPLTAKVSGSKIKAFVWDINTLCPLAKRYTLK